MCFRKTPEPKIPGFDICLCRKSIRKRFAFSRFAPDYRLENCSLCKIRLFQRFVCYKCVTKEHTILFCKSLFIFFRMIPHLIRLPRHVYITPPPLCSTRKKRTAHCCSLTIFIYFFNVFLLILYLFIKSICLMLRFARDFSLLLTTP